MRASARFSLRARRRGAESSRKPDESNRDRSRFVGETSGAVADCELSPELAQAIAERIGVTCRQCAR